MKAIFVKVLREILIGLMIGAVFVHAVGCKSYLAVKTLDENLEYKKLERLARKTPEYVLLHQGGEMFKLRKLRVEEKVIYGELAAVDIPVYFREDREKKRYNKMEEPTIVYEIHIYLHAESGLPETGTPVSISFSDVDRIQIINRDGWLDLAQILGVVVIVIGVVVAVGVLSYDPGL